MRDADNFFGTALVLENVQGEFRYTVYAARGSLCFAGALVAAPCKRVLTGQQDISKTDQFLYGHQLGQTPPAISICSKLP
jgi:hypothetical protein